MSTTSTMLPLGTRAPEFALVNAVDGATVRLTRAPATLVMFICNHCPYVQHVRHELAQLGRDYMVRGVAVYAINSNDYRAYPEDAPAAMAREARQVGYPFPYLIDETQSVARAYHAACTPDFFVFGALQELVYRGQLDGSRPRNDIPVTGTDVRTALDAVLSDNPVSSEQTPSVGCGIKWRS